MLKPTNKIYIFFFFCNNITCYREVDFSAIINVMLDFKPLYFNFDVLKVILHLITFQHEFA